MINRKTALLTLVLVLVALVLFVFTCDAPEAEAATVPQWVGKDLDTTSGVGGAGKYPVLDAVVGDRVLTTIQLLDIAGLQISFWGRNYKGDWTRTPADGYAVGDTALYIASGSASFHFNSIPVEVIVITGGQATIWGE